MDRFMNAVTGFSKLKYDEIVSNFLARAVDAWKVKDSGNTG